MSDEEVEKEYNEFWKDIVENEDGTINKEQLKKELSDYSMVMNNCSSAYMEMTKGLISKPNTMFFEVLNIFQYKFFDADFTKDDIAEMIDKIDDLQELKDDLKDYFDIK